MNQAEQEILINEVEKDIDRLHALYNQYFMGIEKLEPTVVRKNLDRKIYLLRREQIKNTALRFRLQMQIQKYNTQSTYWTRICRQIENGTYTRHVMLAKKRIEARHGDEGTDLNTDILVSQMLLGDEETGQMDADMISFDIDLDDPFASDAPLGGAHQKDSSQDAYLEISGKKAYSKELMDAIDDPFADLTAEKKAQPISNPHVPAPPAEPVDPGPSGRSPVKVSLPIPSASGAKPPPIPTAAQAKPAAVASLSRDRAESLYRRYLAARKKCNEPLDNISFDGVAKSLNAKLKAEGGAVDFKVVIRGGKAVIKTVKSGSPSDKA